MARNQTTRGPSTTPPVWAKDFRSRDHLIPGGVKLDPAAFFPQDSFLVTLTQDSAANDTTLDVAATGGILPDNTLLDFGTGKFARVNGVHAAGVTVVAVDAIPTAMVTGDVARYPGTGSYRKQVKSGTVIGRTIAERDAKTPYGPAADADAAGEVYIVAFDVDDLDEVADAVLYRPGSVVAENYLPGFAGLSAAVKAFVRDRYHCIIGQD